MLMLILIIYCAPVRSTEYTDVITDNSGNVNPVSLRSNGRQTDETSTKREAENTVDACQRKQQIGGKRAIFKNPEHIWGKEFNNTNIRSLCEASIFTRGNNVESINFTKRGKSTCSKVCNKQSQSILRVTPTAVALTDNYCTKRRLMPASCVCVLKVSCQEYKHFAFIHFIVNRVGGVAMLYFEAGHPITMSLEQL